MCLFVVFCCVVFQRVAIHFWWLFNFPIFLAPTFSPFSPFGFKYCTCLFFPVVIQFSHFSCSHIFPIFPFWFSMLHMYFFFVFVTTMFLVFQGGFPMINGFSIVSRPPVFPLGFFSIRGGGFEFGTISPNPPSLRTQEVPPSIGPPHPPPTSIRHTRTSDIFLNTLRTRNTTSDIKHQTLYTILSGHTPRDRRPWR